MQGMVDFLLLAILRCDERSVQPSVKAVSVQVVLSWLHKAGRHQSKRFSKYLTTREQQSVTFRARGTFQLQLV